MKRYQDFKEKDSKEEELSKEEIGKVKWTKYKIIVPTEEDKKEVLEALEHMHYSDIDTDYVTVNQMAHEYLDGNNVIVDKILYNKL
jgi:hypothetical protein